AALAAAARRAAALRAAADPAPPAADGNAPALALLSPREREVLNRIAAGDSNKLIARVFELSPHTVKRHVANILDKLALASRGQAAAWYREHV
ncbi:MAG TPA: LuxR C-terminal-related transcriptional regulator, partial [Methylibium sp.]|nr:LuxR C-terminal-related transcriptional regulator [Methylibium sp.]